MIAAVDRFLTGFDVLMSELAFRLISIGLIVSDNFAVPVLGVRSSLESTVFEKIKFHGQKR